MNKISNFPTVKTTTLLALAALAGSNVAQADIQHQDDVIIFFSLCVGNDCVNGENFSFDTIRLKENNLRIHFDDTSNSASFPRNDWRLIANGSNNGDTSYFAIEDSTAGRIPFRVEAGAPADSLYVDDGGRIGFGTATPSVELHVVDGDTPTLRLQQDGSSGFTPQAFDLAGNETNFFVRDVTNGSTLPFRIRPGAPTSAIDIAADGDVGIGTASPSVPLHVRRTNGTAAIFVEEASSTVAFRNMVTMSNNSGLGFRLTDTSRANQNLDFNHAGGEFRVNFDDGDGPELRLDASGNLIVAGTVTPDYVFAPDYPLMPLDQLAEFVRQEKHLPTIPSTEESKKMGGINIIQFQMKLLEKIEELTLYTIQQEEKILALEARLQDVTQAEKR